MSTTPQNRRKTGVGRGGVVPPPDHRFKPGQSGNPGGRPKTKLITQAYQELLMEIDPKTGKTKATLIAEKTLKEALKGNLTAVKEATDRTEGKALQQLGVGVSVTDDLPEILAAARKRVEAYERGD